MKMNNKTRTATLATTLGAVGIALACCTGGTDGESAGGASANDFVATDSSTGSISLSVVDRDMGVSETSGFGVRVTDAQGRGVPGIRISCDTETGVALLEPSSGSEITDSNGNASGVIGCAAPGSYQMACRLPVGGNKRQLIDIVCRPPIPTDFTGFPNAGGGGLGGGSDTNDSGGVGGTDTDGVRIKSVGYIDDGNITLNPATTFSIDTLQENCSDPVGAGTPTPAPQFEPFFDTAVSVTVQNNTNQLITCTTADYTIANAGTLANSGTSFVSDTLALQGEAGSIETNGGESSFVFLVFNASNAHKFFAGSSTLIPDDYGFKGVTITLHCANDLGDDVDISSAQTLSFANFDRCNN